MGTVLISILLASGVSLSGQVVNDQDQPVAGAVVRITGIYPLGQRNTTCPSCPSQCRTVRLTDAQGRFRFDNVPENANYKLSAGAIGFQGACDVKVDTPSDDKRLQLKSLANLPPSKRIAGRILDDTGQPIAAANVFVGTVNYMPDEDGRVFLAGPRNGITPSTVCDEKGEFVLNVPVGVSQIQLHVAAPGFAGATIADWKVGQPRQDFRLSPGSSLSGRLVHKGKPVAGLPLGVTGTNRFAAKVSRLVVHTKSDGTFSFDHLPSETPFYLYSLMELPIDAALPMSLVTTPKPKLRADFGDVTATKPHRLNFKIAMPDGDAFPEQVRCYLSREGAYHASRRTATPDNPQVKFQGVPSETKTFSMRMNGYEIDHSVPRFQVNANGMLLVPSEADTQIVVHVRRR